jgi:hypothetical protein
VSANCITSPPDPEKTSDYGQKEICLITVMKNIGLITVRKNLIIEVMRAVEDVSELHSCVYKSAVEM